MPVRTSVNLLASLQGLHEYAERSFVVLVRLPLALVSYFAGLGGLF
jgi:hypothetical protein